MKNFNKFLFILILSLAFGLKSQNGKEEEQKKLKEESYIRLSILKTSTAFTTVLSRIKRATFRDWVLLTGTVLNKILEGYTDPESMEYFAPQRFKL